VRESVCVVCCVCVCVLCVCVLCVCCVCVCMCVREREIHDSYLWQLCAFTADIMPNTYTLYMGLFDECIGHILQICGVLLNLQNELYHVSTHEPHVFAKWAL